MSASITRLARARKDLADAAVYVGRSDPAVADRFLHAVEETLAKVLEMPGTGSLWDSPESELAEVRWKAVSGFEKWLLFYRATAHGIEVIRILYSSRDIEAALADI